jgi:hypothetical protein
LIAAAGALGLAAFAFAEEPTQTTTGQTVSSGQSADPTAPATTQSQQSSMPSEPSTAGSAGNIGGQNTRLAALVPAGMSPDEACTGFKSVDECAATLHASQNLGIPFPDLKSRVTSGKNLGAAIHDLKPEAKAKAEVRKAEEQARVDVRPQG